MKTIGTLLVGLAMLAGAAASASAADCKLKGWVDSGTNGRPIFDCSGQAN